MDIRKVKFFFVFLFVYCLLTEITKGQTAKIYETNEILGKEGGFLIAPAHILDPSIPWDNIIAFVDAVNNL